MKWNQKRYFLLIAIPLLLSVLIASCTAKTATSTQTTQTAVSTQTVTNTETITATTTVISTPPTVTVTAVPAGTTLSPTPTIFGSNILKDAKFFSSKEISSYITATPTPKTGNPSVTPVYTDVFVTLPEIARFTKEDATFVPRIPSVTTYDDWFVRFSIPTVNAKPWLINWKYALAPGDISTTLTFYLFRKSDFDANYYKHPVELVNADLKAVDWGVSENGFYTRQLQNMLGDFVFVFRTNDPGKVQGWLVRIGM
jgi:hypothetical protein